MAEAEASEKAARRVSCSVGQAMPMTSCDSCVPGDVGDAAVRLLSLPKQFTLPTLRTIASLESPTCWRSSERSL